MITTLILANKKHLRLLYYAVLFVISGLISFVLWILGGVLIGAGHGPTFPFEAVVGPYGLYIVSWPFLVIAANCQVYWLRLISQISVIIYYIWLCFRWQSVSDTIVLFSHYIVSDADWVMIAWAASFFFLHCLIWLPARFCTFETTGIHSNDKTIRVTP